MLKLLSETLVLLSEGLDLVLTFEKAPLIVVFLGTNDGNLVLHVAEFDNLLLKLHFGLLQFGGLVVQLLLDIINACVKSSNRVLEINDFLVLYQQLSLVVLDIVLKYSFVAHFTFLFLG